MSPRGSWPRGGVRTRLPVVFRKSGAEFTPRDISGLALWLDASDTASLYTTDAGAVTAVSAPTEIAGCVGWWDASDASSITQSGGLVSQWNDKSGQGNHATASTTARPTTGTRTVGGKNALDFDGVANLMSADAAAAALSGNDKPVTIFVVYDADLLPNPSTLIAFNSSSSNLPYGQFFRTDGTFWQHYKRDDGNTTTAFQQVGAASTSASVLSAVVPGTSISSYSNGLAGISGASFDTPLVTLNRFSIGGTNPSTGAGAFIDGLVCEVVLFNTALSNADRARVEAYLAAKWGISGVHTPATATSDPVGAWLDKSGNARHATQSTAGSRPTISATNQGGRKALAFASQSQTVVSPATVAQYAADATTSPKMFFAWVARPEGGAASVVFGSPTHPNAASRVFYASDFGAAGNHIVDFGSVSTARLTGTVGDEANNVGHVYSAFRDGAVMSVRRDGVEILRKTDTTGVYTDTTGTLSINTVSGGSATSSWMEFMAYAASLPAASIARLERYLAAKWGITLAPQVSNADAQNWIDRVYANGGTVSSSTAAAVNTLCIDLENASLRDRFYRLNLFCGTGLNAALVPLYRGPSLGGTQYGNTTDTNVGPFVSGDYAETGASGGLNNASRTKYLNTGFPTNTVPAGDRHLAFYERTFVNADYDDFIGSESAASISQQFALGHQASASTVAFRFGASTSAVQSGAASAGAFWLGVHGSSTGGVVYKNGVLDGAGTLTAATPTTSEIHIFGVNRASVAANVDRYGGTSGGYSIGLSMTAPQAAAYHTAMQAFQAALTRNV